MHKIFLLSAFLGINFTAHASDINIELSEDQKKSFMDSLADYDQGKSYEKGGSGHFFSFSIDFTPEQVATTPGLGKRRDYCVMVYNKDVIKDLLRVFQEGETYKKQAQEPQESGVQFKAPLDMSPAISEVSLTSKLPQSPKQVILLKCAGASFLKEKR